MFPTCPKCGGVLKIIWVLGDDDYVGICRNCHIAWGIEIDNHGDNVFVDVEFTDDKGASVALRGLAFEKWFDDLLKVPQSF